MAQHSGPSDLPATWPFRAAGTLVILAMVYWCAGFAVEDVEGELWQHKPVFFVLLLAALVLVIGGAAYNHQRERRRTHSV